MDAIYSCKNIEKFLKAEQGIKYFKHVLAETNIAWNLKYADTFNRLSHYKTIITNKVLAEANIESTYGQIFEFIRIQADCTVSELASDLVCLLELYNTWNSQFITCGGIAEKSALNLLKRDIYFLFEWLCSSGLSETELFQKWSYNDRQPQHWTQLKDVLDFEEISIEETFHSYVPVYSESISNWLVPVDINCIYNTLIPLDGFDSWIHSFHDLHSAINVKDGIIMLSQPRILDNLLVITIRTEIVLRSLYTDISSQEDIEDLQDVLKGYSEIDNVTQEFKGVMLTLSGGESWELTKLQTRPETIFQNIENSIIGKKWPPLKRYFFHSLLKFITSRNYFAHHSYKDNELNDQVSELAGEVLVACLHTLLYVTHNMQGHDNDSSTGI